MHPYAGKSAPTLKRIRPNAVRSPEVTRGFPLVGNGLGGIPQRKTEVPDAWELTVVMTAGGQNYTVDITTGTGPAITIDWGDGRIEQYASIGTKDHTYNAPGLYVIRITGRFTSGGNFRLGSNSGNRARLKATSIVPFIPGLANFYNTFTNCTGITSVPVDIFRYNPQVAVNAFTATFRGTGLASIPPDLFRYNVNASTSAFNTTFHSCSKITSVPVDIFRYNTLVSTSGFHSTFYDCTGITLIPADIFRYNTEVSTQGFYATFYGCTGITSVPVDIFRYNTEVSTSGFNSTFYDCTGLTSIPTDLFRYNTLVSTSGFNSTFYGCTGITSVPVDIFRYNTEVTAFASAFYGCTGLATIPALLFKYNTACTSFFAVFQNCNKLQLRADLFFDTGEEGTRFLNQTVNFTSAMSIGTFTGTQGTAPALWSCDFGTGTPTKTDCFQGHTTSTVDNYASISAEWL